MANVELFRSQAQITAQRNLAEFIRYCREELTWLGDRKGFDWDSAVWPLVHWCKLSVGKRRHFKPEECLDSEFADFAKAYFRWKQTDHETALTRIMREGVVLGETQGPPCGTNVVYTNV